MPSFDTLYNMIAQCQNAMILANGVAYEAEHAKPPAESLGPFSSKAKGVNYISAVLTTKPKRDAQVIKDARLL